MRDIAEEMATTAASKPHHHRAPPPPPSIVRRSLRPRTDRLFVADDYYDSSSPDERGTRKPKLVLKLPYSPAILHPSPDSTSEEYAVKPLKKRRLTAPQESKKNVIRMPKPSVSGTPPDCQKGTPLPERFTLKAVLNKLQKKDTYSAFAEPVDLEELPDYHEVIEHPMDFGTVRKKLGAGAYRTFEQFEESKKNVIRMPKPSVSGTPLDCQKGTPLPERFTLEAVLNKLQKKDTYSAFAEPVDLEELPDYHEVIEHPMDFGTVRKKLGEGAYRTFEQFEDDVFLICSNAMQYNAPHTIYFRQARAIEEMARNNFQTLRYGVKGIKTERNSEEKIKFSSTEMKPLNKSLYRDEKGLLGSHVSSIATLALAGDTRSGLSTTHDKAFNKVAAVNGLNKRRTNDCEKPAISSGFRLSQANAAEKAATSSGMSMTANNAVRKPATANWMSKAQTNDFHNPATSKGLNMAPSSAFNKSATSKGFSRAPAKSREKSPVANKLTMEQANTINKPTPASGLNIAQSNSVEKFASAIGLSTKQDNVVEKPAASSGSSKVQANVIEEPAISNGLTRISDNTVAEPSICNGFSTTQSSMRVEPTTANGFLDGNSNQEKHLSEREDIFSEKCSPSSLGQRPLLVDENRRKTYNQTDQNFVVESDSVFSIFDSETKQLVVVGSHSDYSYAKSLAHFAAFLGPIGWEIASKKIEKALPAGIKFGPGWVGKYEPLPTPILSFENHSQKQLRCVPNLPCRLGSRRDKKSEVMSKPIQNVDIKDMPSGLKSQVTTGMPRRASYPSERSILGRNKQGLLDCSNETQTRITNAMLQRQKDQQPVNPDRSYNDVSERFTLCNSSSLSSIPVEKAKRKPDFHSEAHTKRYDVSADIHPKGIDEILQWQKDQEAIGFARACNNVSEQVGLSNSSSVSHIPIEAALQRPNYHSQTLNQGLFGISAVNQQRITTAMLYQQTDQVIVDFSKVCNSASEQVYNLSSVRNVPRETSFQRSEYNLQAKQQGLFGVSAEIQPRRTSVMSQHKNDQVDSDLYKIYSDVQEHIGVQNSSPVTSIPVETTIQRTGRHSEAASYGPVGETARNRNEVNSGLHKLAETVSSQDSKNTFGSTFGGLSSDRVTRSPYKNRAITSLEFTSNEQSRVAGHCVASGGNEQAIDLRLLGLSEKVLNRPNYLNTHIYSVDQVMSQVSLPRGDVHNPIARTGMPFGAYTDSQSAVGTGVVKRQMGSASYHDSAWNTPTSAATIHINSMVRPQSQVFPQPIPLANEKSLIHNRGLVFFPSDLSRFHGLPWWQGVLPHSQPRQKDIRPPDLNIVFQNPSPPVRPLPGILVDSQQPDLALQLRLGSNIHL